MEAFRFNTMVAALMSFTNDLLKARETAVAGTAAWDEAVRTLVLMLAPSALTSPRSCGAAWEGRYSVHQEAWPAWDDEKAADEIITLIVQVNGKVRDRIEAPADIDEARARELAVNSERVQAHLDGKKVAKTIYVPGKLVNIVAR